MAAPSPLGGLQFAYLLLLLLLSAVGNSATLAVVAVPRCRGAIRRTNRVFFAALAAADLLTGLALLPLAAASSLDPAGAFARLSGSWGCECAAYAAILLLQLAAYLLLASASDHFAAFRWPGRYPTLLSRTRSACWLAALTGLAVLVPLPTAVSRDPATSASFSNSTGACFANWGQESGYHLAVCSVVLLPALLAAFATNGYLLTPDFRLKRLRYLTFEAELGDCGDADSAASFEDTRESFYRDVFAATAVQLATWIVWAAVQVAEGRSPGSQSPVAIFFTFWTAVGNCGWRFLVHCACLRDFRLALRLLAGWLVARCCGCLCRRRRRGGAGGGGGGRGGYADDDSGGFAFHSGQTSVSIGL